jgi:hypothetical protein
MAEQFASCAWTVVGRSVERVRRREIEVASATEETIRIFFACACCWRRGRRV